MKIIIAGGAGFIGKHLMTRLRKDNIEISVIGRNKKKIQEIFSTAVKAFEWRDINSDILRNYDVIINLTGENIGEKRWSGKFKESILASRVESTHTLALLCSKLGDASPRILNASAVGIYGETGCDPYQPLPVDETWEVTSTRLSGFLSYVAWQWERALDVAVANNVSVTIMRFGVVLKQGEGMLQKLSLPVKLGLAGKLGSGQQWLSWIHIDDLIAAIIFLLDHPDMTGVINMTHPLPVMQSEFIHKLARHYHRPCFLNMPAWWVKCLFGEMGEALLLNGQKVIPTRLIAHGFVFSKKNIDDAFL